jgi:hypothetical protein
MSKRYVYKNGNSRPVNIGGYQFEEGQELESDVLIEGFKEAVSNGFLELAERKPEAAEPDATQAQQTGDTGKVKAVFHTGVFEGPDKEVIEEIEIDPKAPVVFPDVSATTPGFDGWFKDAEFSEPVKIDKVKAPKEGEVHFYAKIITPPDDVSYNYVDGADSANQ